MNLIEHRGFAYIVFKRLYQVISEYIFYFPNKYFLSFFQDEDLAPVILSLKQETTNGRDQFRWDINNACTCISCSWFGATSPVMLMHHRQLPSLASGRLATVGVSASPHLPEKGKNKNKGKSTWYFCLLDQMAESEHIKQNFNGIKFDNIIKDESCYPVFETGAKRPIQVGHWKDTWKDSFY